MAQTILLIEDEPILQKTLSAALQQEGYDVKNALDGELGLNLAKEIKPDLILLDLILPKMDGFEVLDALKGDDTLKQTPVIILTNLESPQDVEKALAKGATTYLVKANYELKNIIAKIRETIGAKK